MQHPLHNCLFMPRNIWSCRVCDIDAIPLYTETWVAIFRIVGNTVRFILKSKHRYQSGHYKDFRDNFEGLFNLRAKWRMKLNEWDNVGLKNANNNFITWLIQLNNYFYYFYVARFYVTSKETANEICKYYNYDWARHSIVGKNKNQLSPWKSQIIVPVNQLLGLLFMSVLSLLTIKNFIIALRMLIYSHKTHTIVCEIKSLKVFPNVFVTQLIIATLRIESLYLTKVNAKKVQLMFFLTKVSWNNWKEIIHIRFFYSFFYYFFQNYVNIEFGIWCVWQL